MIAWDLKHSRTQNGRDINNRLISKPLHHRTVTSPPPSSFFFFLTPFFGPVTTRRAQSREILSSVQPGQVFSQRAQFLCKAQQRKSSSEPSRENFSSEHQTEHSSSFWFIVHCKTKKIEEANPLNHLREWTNHLREWLGTKRWFVRSLRWFSGFASSTFFWNHNFWRSNHQLSSRASNGSPKARKVILKLLLFTYICCAPSPYIYYVHSSLISSVFKERRANSVDLMELNLRFYSFVFNKATHTGWLI